MSHFSLEKLGDCQAEIDPVLRNEHWPEVGHYTDIPIEMDWVRYAMLQEMGKLRCFVVRAFTSEEFKETDLHGYAFFIVDKHLHYRNTLVASQDILYVRKQYRGIGRPFMQLGVTLSSRPKASLRSHNMQNHGSTTANCLKNLGMKRPKQSGRGG